MAFLLLLTVFPEPALLQGGDAGANQKWIYKTTWRAHTDLVLEVAYATRCPLPSILLFWGEFRGSAVLMPPK